MGKIMERCLANLYIQNGELIASSLFDDAILKSGPAIYEVLRVSKSTPLFLEEHIDRFLKSAHLLGLRHDMAESSSIRQQIRMLIEENGMHTGNIRIQFINLPDSENLLLAWVTPHSYPEETDYINGVELVTMNATRENPNVKRANLPVREIAGKMIEEKQIAEVLLVNGQGYVTECSRSNIFFVNNGKLTTPHRSLVLEGITRDKVIQLSKSAGIEVTEAFVPHTSTVSFDSCFISSTSKNVLPVRRIDNTQYTVPDKVTNHLKLSFDQMIETYLKNFRW